MEKLNLIKKKQRKIAHLESKPHLYKHVRLRFDPVRNATALLSPEKVFWPDETGLAICELCNGERTVNEITKTLAKEYETSPEEISQDILEFIQHWSDQLLVEL